MLPELVKEAMRPPPLELGGDAAADAVLAELNALHLVRQLCCVERRKERLCACVTLRSMVEKETVYVSGPGGASQICEKESDEV